MRTSTQNWNGPLRVLLICPIAAHPMTGMKTHLIVFLILVEALQIISVTSAFHMEENNCGVRAGLSFCRITGCSRCGTQEYSQMAKIRTARYFYEIF